MGSVCSCFGVADVEEHRNRHGLVYRQGACIRFMAQQLMHMYSLLLQREYHPTPPNSSSLASVAHTTDDSFSGTFRCPPRPLPYDDPRCSGLNVNVLASRYKPSAAFVEESEPFRGDKNNGNSESTSLLDKWSGYNYGASKKLPSESSLNHPSIETIGGAAFMFPSSEEEDVCPTCLEEYTAENPRIILQCSHHFHLGCIYEWMERSDLCPVCGKVMVFNETS